MINPTRAPRRGRPRKPASGLGPELATLRAARERDGRTDAELATAAGISQDTVGRMLSGDRSPRFADVARLRAALGLPWSAFD